MTKPNCCLLNKWVFSLHRHSGLLNSLLQEHHHLKGVKIRLYESSVCVEQRRFPVPALIREAAADPVLCQDEFLWAIRKGRERVPWYRHLYPCWVLIWPLMMHRQIGTEHHGWLKCSAGSWDGPFAQAKAWQLLLKEAASRGLNSKDIYFLP